MVVGPRRSAIRVADDGWGACGPASGGRRRWLLVRELSCWLLRRRLRFRATGRSMQPTLEPGDHLIARRLPASRASVRVGALVVARHPREDGTLVVKRVGRCGADGIWLTSDNPSGSDSRRFGAVSASELVAIVTTSVTRGGQLRLHEVVVGDS